LQDQYANLNSLFEHTRSLDSVEFASGSAFSELAIRSQFLIVLEYLCQSFYRRANLGCTYNMTIDGGESTIMADILKVCKNGCTKEKIIEQTHLSHDQLRRITAEIVDKGLLRYIEHQQVYITTNKGYIFLDSRDYNEAMKGRSDG
jgi:predicted transcriptional regulator